jgi:hypothetical protein
MRRGAESKKAKEKPQKEAIIFGLKARTKKGHIGLRLALR